MNVLLLTPALRILGNLYASAHVEEVLPHLTSDATHFKHLMLAAQAPQHGLQKEALWVLSNLAGLQTENRYSRALEEMTVSLHLLAYCQCSGKRISTSKHPWICQETRKLVEVLHFCVKESSPGSVVSSACAELSRACLLKLD